MGWANLVTAARAILTGALWALLAWASPAPPTGVWWAAFALFAFTAATDAVDGALARYFQEVSSFGRIADPLVDKLLVLGTMVVLLGIDGVRGTMPPWTVALILARELVVTGLRSAVEGRGVSFGAIGFGKTKMFLQSVAVGAVLLAGAGVAFFAEPLGGRAPWSVAHLLVLAATAVTVLSGVPYVRRAASALSAGRA
jgi:CDP-diacylglycerol--glycerol-3-phosphate 3-phosphatidyltransferase